MKCFALLLLIIISFGVMVPASLVVMVPHHAETGLAALNVCHSAAPALAANGDMPCVSESIDHYSPSFRFASLDPATPLFPASHIPSRDERPPQA